MLLIECALVFAALLFAFGAPTLGAGFFARIECAFAMLAGKRSLSVIVVGLTALALRAALLPVEPIPEPGMHDEFSYLLAADTFAHGRLANPTHPLWKHFETFQVLQRPTYVSKFPPAQGLFLAAGQVIFGHPFWGVWLSVGVMCAAIYWMLLGWLPPPWALLGGLLAAIRLGSYSYWANSYWGGAVAALGGALVLGALPRIKRSQRVRDSLLMGVGLAILANSRPYEGLFLSAPVGILLLLWICRKRSPSLQLSMRRIVLPLGAVILVAGSAMVYYFWRTTGKPFLPPYQVHQEMYQPVPLFPWQQLKSEPEYHHVAMRNFYLGWELEQYKFAVSHPGWLIVNKSIVLWSFFLGPALTVPLLLFVVTRPYGLSRRRFCSRKAASLLFILSISCAGLLLPVCYAPHYAAPLTSVIFALTLIAMGGVRRWRAGLFMVRAVPAICLIMLLLRAAAGPLHIPLTQSYSPTWFRWDKSFPRAAVLTHLQELPRDHLVLVRYRPEHEAPEWVFNNADIDAAKVVWARDMSPAENEELIRYFSNRHLWLLEADEKPPRLSEYPIESLPPRSARIKDPVPAPTPPAKP